MPSLTGLALSVTFGENTVNAAPQLLDANVLFTDVENDFNGGTLTLSGLLADDRISVRNEGLGGGQIGLSDGNVTFGGVLIGTLAGGSGSTLTITFNSAATATAIDALIQNLTYANASNAPTASRDLVLNVTDAGGNDLVGPEIAILDQQSGGTNPFGGIVGTQSNGHYLLHPTLADYDHDGDVDLITGYTYPGLLLFQNNDGVFTEVVGAGNPFSDLFPIFEGYDSGPTFVDIDGDDDLDLVVGDNYGAIHLYQNNNTVYTELTGGANPFSGVSGGNAASPVFVDADGDGDLDLVVGGRGGAFPATTGVLRYYSNTGGVFTQQTGGANPFNGIDVVDFSRPTFADLDGDGDQDLVLGNYELGVKTYRNNGNGTFTELTGAANPFDGLDLGTYTNPAFGDVDGDGDMDLIVANSSGTIAYFLNNAVPPVHGQTITVGVTAQNDAPVATGAATLGSVNEDTAAPGGQTVSTLFGSLFSDADGNTLAGVAITGNAVTSQGVWQYFNGAWVTVGSPSEGAALVLAAGTLVRFVPAANYNGSPPALTAYLIDNSGGAVTTGGFLDVSVNGGQTRFSDTSVDLTTTITAVNDTPTVPATATTVGATEQTAATLLGAVTVSDVDLGNRNGGNGDFGGASFTVQRGSANAQDAFAFGSGGLFTVSGGDLQVGGLTFATFTSTGGVLTISFSSAGATATTALVNDVINHIRYTNSSDAPPSSVTLNYVLNDGAPGGGQGSGGAASAGGAVIVNITAVNDLPTGGVSVTGTTAEDNVLTAVSTVADPDGLGTLHYQWQHDIGGGYVNVGADQATYALGDGDIGGVVRVVLYYTDAGGTVESATSAATAAISATNDAPTGGVSVTGTATEDQVLTADTSTLADSDGLGTLHYDWQRDTGSGFVSTGAADQGTYTLGDSDVGGVVRVVISYTDGQGFANSVTSAASATIFNINDDPTGGASITGTTAEDQVLTAVSTIADIDGLGTLHYQWQHDVGDGYVNVGADQSTYALGDGDVGGVVRVVIYYTDAGGTVESATSAATAAIANVNDSPTGGVVITGTRTENQVLTANTSSLGDADGVGTLHYQWQRDTGSGFVNVGTDQATYTLGDADVGGIVRVVTSYHDQRGTAEAVTSDGAIAIGGVNDPHTGGVTLSGTRTEDRVLTAVTSTLADIDGLGTLHYQWQRNTGSGYVNIGSDQATYTLVDADVGGVVRVVVSYTDGQGFLERAASGSSGTIANNDPAVAVDDAFTRTEGGANLTGNVFSNNGAGADNDVDGPTLRVATVNGSAVGSQITLASGALLTLNANGTFTYNQNGAFDHLAGAGSGAANTTATDSFTYTLVSGGTATVTITINGVDGAGDELEGTVGGDTLNGGSGADTMAGGQGDDTYIVNNAGDVIIEARGEGYDTVRSSVDVSIYGGYVDAIVLVGTGNTEARGNGSDNTLTGNSGNNLLIGGKGADVMTGGAGDDSYRVDDLGDRVIEDRNGGTDEVRSSVSFSLYGGYVENLFLTGPDAIDATGNGLNNILVGNSAANVINGGKGADAMSGGLGDDTYYVDDLGDTVIEIGGQGVDSVFSYVSFSIVDQYVENLTLSGSAAIDATGNGQENVITGNAAANVIDAGKGNDRIQGGGGADILTGGPGADLFVYVAASDSTRNVFDHITDLSSDDVIDLSAIDARTDVSGNDGFTLVSAFSNVSGQMRISYSASTGQTTFLMDINGDSVADMRIVADGDHHDFTNFLF